jgi:hypothetical protein
MNGITPMVVSIQIPAHENLRNFFIEIKVHNMPDIWPGIYCLYSKISLDLIRS